VFDRKEPAGAREAALHLVGHQHDAVLVAQRAQALQEVERRDVIAALALHRFDHDGGHARRFNVGLEQLLDSGHGVVHRYAVTRHREGCVVNLRAEVQPTCRARSFRSCRWKKLQP
jgi:hypothetical protein